MAAACDCVSHDGASLAVMMRRNDYTAFDCKHVFMYICISNRTSHTGDEYIEIEKRNDVYYN